MIEQLKKIVLEKDLINKSKECFWNAFNNWKQEEPEEYAKDLKTSDTLLLSNGTQVQINAINVEKLKTPETTYNFEVADFHTYYVTESKVFVHNDCKPTSPVKVKDSYIRNNKIDPHALKKEVLGNKNKDIAKFDIFRDTANNKRIWLGNKSQTIWHDQAITLMI